MISSPVVPSNVKPHALREEELHTFLRRKRRKKGTVKLPPLGAFLAETLTMTSRLVPSQAGSLLLDDPSRRGSGSALTFVASFGPSAKDMMGVHVPKGEGIVGHVYGSGKTYISNNVDKDPRFFKKIDGQTSFRTKSVVAAPLFLERQVCGVFELINRNSKTGFSEHDVELVELIASYISRAILNAVDIIKRNELAFRDDLTGLWNPRSLQDTLQERVRAALRREGDVGAMFIDMDKLKPLNDKFGHRVGSEAIRRVGKGIEEIVGDDGIAFRFGGDEFVVILPKADLATATALGESVYRDMPRLTKGKIRGGGTMPGLSVSVGVASLDGSLRKGGARDHTSLASRLLTAADNALYRAKREGRGRIAVANTKDDNFGK
ncbi:MAG: sensor domain-containing diguanylate cyclase [Myxococcales bacterium]|nr:sensor domain-containing diguanylate cyclase [Myxococcales bacterium]